MEHINWYPGHMKKTKELIIENLKMVDVVVEVIDARIPISSRNPIIHELIKHKQRIIVLNKNDLSDKKENDKWADYFKGQGYQVLSMNCNSGEGLGILEKMLLKLQEEKNEGRVRNRFLRLMIVGVPNVGKSSLINRLTGKKSARTGNKPGVTRGKQWINIAGGMQVLDTPGILWPKFEDRQVGLMLSFTGSIKDEILDRESLCVELIALLSREYSQLLMERFRLEALGETPLETMEMICVKRGFIFPGQRFDYERAARTIMDEFRAGKMGKISLEKVKIKEKLEENI